MCPSSSSLYLLKVKSILCKNVLKANIPLKYAEPNHGSWIYNETPENSLFSCHYVKPAVSLNYLISIGYWYFELCQGYPAYCSSVISMLSTLITVSPWIDCSERLSNAVFVSCGSGAANIQALLTSVYHGGPALIPDLGLFGIVVFDPLPIASLFWVCESLRPQNHGSSISKWGWEFLALRWNLLTFPCAVTSALTHIQLHSVLHPVPHNSFLIWLQWSDI